MTTKLIETREPTPAEKKRGAEVAFVRKEGDREHVILACKCYESWEQWGAPREVLSENVPTVERWRVQLREDRRARFRSSNRFRN